MSAQRILVIGSTNTDMVIEAPTLPVPGQTVLGDTFHITPGGKGANQAVAAARAGATVVFITALGDDALGVQRREQLAHDHIDVSHVVIKQEQPTGVALIVVDAHGENLIAAAPGANWHLLPDDLVPAVTAFVDAKLLIMQLEIPLESVIWAAAYAKQLGCPILLNPAPMSAQAVPDSLWNNVDILTPNEGELRQLVPAADTVEEAANAMLKRGVKMLVVTQGSHGATVFTSEESFHVPAFAVATVDTVGAGDCFSGALGVALAEGQPVRDAVRFAAAAAAISTTISGAQDSMPTRDKIEALLVKA